MATILELAKIAAEIMHLNKRIVLNASDSVMYPGFGSPRIRSSPAKQQRLELNRDVTKDPKKGESEKLREGQ